MTDIILIISVTVTCMLVLWIALTATRQQKQGIEKLYSQLQGWIKAQEVRRKRWEEQQEKDRAMMEARLMAHIEHLQLEERRRKLQETDRAIYELSHLPRIEDTPLPTKIHIADPVNAMPQMPRSFHGANLAGFDLSYRYLRYADLRNANLAQANLFMADLTGACLRGAKLNRADLSAANFMHADLTDADLSETNTLVTDFYDAILVGANLRNTRNLTNEQIRGAIVDRTTELDKKIDITLPRIPRIALH
ncbi:hypothetical protein KDA_37380 [Dictyobacter alpinus]|uniref:Pentapeptide repeat-containing protein n=1 Tax=Dictyobacter alpinus TaxID=2014873 RepID=A0A402BA38_9CHLR|nr:pentapeptide repeat-containing protein [Dictyobacter alpinus]GCE28254.1 hypothetical protein KDA_37380 [Dictyobacter alpinus]